MEKYAWKGRIAEGMLDEYVRRHNEIWDEMKEVLDRAGIRNYTIWNTGNEVFGYYECEYGFDYAAKVQRESPVAARWREYMKDILILDRNPETNAPPALKKVFSFK